MAKNQQQHTNVKEQIFETVATIVDESIKDLGYNITKIGIITDADEAKWHKYKVKCGSLEMNVVDDNRTGNYKVNDVVRITIPNGNYNAKKVIEGLYSAGSEEDTVYVQPRNHFVPMTKEYKLDIENYKIYLNQSNKIVEKEIFSTSTNDYFSFSNTEIFNSIYLKFSHSFHDIPSKLISGEFIIKLKLLFQDSDKNIEKEFSSLNLVGDPYSSIGFTNDILWNLKNGLAGLSSILLEAYIPEENNDFIDINKNIIKTGYINLKDISIELGHKYIDQNGIKLFTDDSLDYGHVTGDYKKKLKYIWYRTDENKNFLGFEKGSFNEFDSEKYVEVNKLNNIYQSIISDEPDSELYNDEKGLDLKFNYNEANSLVQKLTNELNNLKYSINDFSTAFQKKWVWNKNGVNETLWDVSESSSDGYILADYWLINTAIVTLLSSWNHTMSSASGGGRLVDKLLQLTIPDSGPEMHWSKVFEVNSERYNKLIRAKNLSLKGWQKVLPTENDKQYQFQLSHITNEKISRWSGAVVKIANSTDDFKGYEYILKELKKIINHMKEGVLRATIPNMDVYYDNDYFWNENTFISQGKSQFIQNYYKPINEQALRLQYIEEQINLHNEKVKAYYKLRNFLRESMNDISNNEANNCVKLNNAFNVLNNKCAEFFTTKQKIDLTNIEVVDIETYLTWIEKWEEQLANFFTLSLELRREYDSSYSVPDTESYEIYVTKGVLINNSLKKIKKYLNSLTDLGYTLQSSEKQNILNKYILWKDDNNLTPWKPYVVEQPKNALDIKFLETDQNILEINIWNGQSGWKEVDLQKTDYWPIMGEKYVASRFFPIMEEIDLSQKARLKEEQSYQIIVIYNNEIIQSNILTFKNYANYNIFSQNPYLKVNYKNDNMVYALSNQGSPLIYTVEGYEQNNINIRTNLWDENQKNYPKLTFDYGTYGMGSSQSEENLSGNFGVRNENGSIKEFIIQPLYLNENLLEKYIFSVMCLNIYFEDDIERKVTIPIPLSTFSDLQLNGPKTVIFKNNNEVVFDTDDPTYEIFSKKREIDKDTLQYQIILLDRYTGTVQDTKNFLYINQNNQLEILTDFNTLYSYLPILEISGLCKKESSWEQFIYRHPILLNTEKSLRGNYNNSSLSSIIERNANNIYSSNISNAAGMINIQHSYISNENIENTTNWTRFNQKTTNSQVIDKGLVKIQSRFPYFTFMSNNDKKKFEIDLTAEAPLRFLYNNEGIEFYYDGTICLLKKDLEPILINYDTLTDGTLGIQIQQIGVIQDDEIISTCN